jgi:hypothetical protein
MGMKMGRKTNSETMELTRCDKEQIVLSTKIMRLTLSESLEYCKSSGYKINKDYYYEILRNIDQSTDTKALEIAKKDFLAQHMTRISQLETVEREMWINYRNEEQPFRKSMILEKIANIQPFIARAYESTINVMEKQAELKSKILVRDLYS